jgi:HEAT repeat protein
VAAALADIGAVAAIPELRELIGDPDYRVAHEAAGALVRLGPKGERELTAVAAASGGLAAEHAMEALSGLRLAHEREAARSARLTAAAGRAARSAAGTGDT